MRPIPAHAIERRAVAGMRHTARVAEGGKGARPWPRSLSLLKLGLHRVRRLAVPARHPAGDGKCGEWGRIIDRDVCPGSHGEGVATDEDGTAARARWRGNVRAG